MSVAVYEETDESADLESLEVPPVLKEPRTSVPPPIPAKPSDLLAERRTMARVIFGGHPTAQRLREHAERHGVDGIAETAAESGMSEESLTALIISLDRINATMRRDPRRKHLYRSPAKTSAERRARELLGVEEPEKP